MRVVYEGPAAAVRVPEAGVTAERGKPVEVPHGIARRLINQGGWRTPARRRRTKPKTDKES